MQDRFGEGEEKTVAELVRVACGTSHGGSEGLGLEKWDPR